AALMRPKLAAVATRAEMRPVRNGQRRTEHVTRFPTCDDSQPQKVVLRLPLWFEPIRQRPLNDSGAGRNPVGDQHGGHCDSSRLARPLHIGKVLAFLEHYGSMTA